MNGLYGLRKSDMQEQDLCFYFDVADFLKDRDIFWDVLSLDEQNRAVGYCVEDAKQEFIVSRGVLRFIIAHFQECNPRKVCFQTNDWGKLEIKSDSFFFNVSHSRGKVMVGVSSRGDIGVDIECQRERDSYRSISERFFSSEEKQWLKREKSMQLERFYDIWVAKEAVSKALGLGMALPLSAYSVVSDTRHFSIEVPSNKRFSTSTTWYLKHVSPFEGYSACVASPFELTAIKFFQL